MKKHLIFAGLITLMLASCAPAPLTVGVSYGEGKPPGNNYFDRNMNPLNPGDETRISKFLPMRIVNSGDNKTEKLLSIITEAGGVCNTSGNIYNCEIDRKYVSDNCAFGKCSKSNQNWILYIKWNSAVQNFVPDIKAKIFGPRLISRNY